MMNLKIVNKAKYWCAKTLVYRGFPTPPLKKYNAPKKYCKNYPCLYITDNSLDSIEFQESIDEINSEAAQLFSLSNLDFVSAAITDQIFKFCCYLLIFFYLLTMLLFMFDFEHKWIFVQWLSPVLIVLGVILYIYSKVDFKNLRLKYIEIFCILEVFYISMDLSSNNNLRNKKIQNSLVRRIFNLSRLIYMSGQKKRYAPKDLKQHYYRISLEIRDKIKWIYSAQNSTLIDLRKYFNHITYCLVIGKIGEIKVDQSISEQQPKRDSENLISKTEKAIMFSERIFVLIKKVMNLFFT